MRSWPTLFSVTLATCLTGCGIAANIKDPPGPAFAPGYTPTEEEIARVEQASAAKLSGETRETLTTLGGVPYVSDTRLLFMAGFHQQATLPTGMPVSTNHVHFGKLLDRGNLLAHAFGAGKFALDPPLVSLLSIGSHSAPADEVHRKAGPQYAARILRLPSLTLVGTQPDQGAQPGTPAYGGRMDPLFAQADQLVRASSLACQPEAATMAERREGTEALPWRNRSNNAWSKDTFHRRSYDCARRVAKYDRGFPNTNFAILATVFPAHPADAEMTRTYGYSGITGTLAQAGDPFATVSFAWLDEFPHLGGDQAAWTLVDELQAAIPEGWYVVLSAAPRGSKGAPLDVFVGRKQGGGLQMTSVGKAPQ